MFFPKDFNPSLKPFAQDYKGKPTFANSVGLLFILGSFSQIPLDDSNKQFSIIKVIHPPSRRVALIIVMFDLNVILRIFMKLLIKNYFIL